MSGPLPDLKRDGSRTTHFPKSTTDESLYQHTGLKLVTDFHTQRASSQPPPNSQPLSGSQPSYSAVSMVPTPVLSQSTSPLFVQSHSEVERSETEPNNNNNNSRTVSASFVPDQTGSLQLLNAPTQSSTYHQNLMKPRSNIVPARSNDIHRADSLMVAKRDQNTTRIHVQRSASVGGPQRQPSTVLHRELKTGTVYESPSSLREEVYLAHDSRGSRTAWTRIKFVGKGSFSDVVLAKPAFEFVKPECIDDVENSLNRELSEFCSDADSSLHKTKSVIRTHNLLVAVKITTLKPGKSSAQLDYFRRDLEIMSELPTHPCLMRLIGSSIDETLHNRAIYVLPFCEGGDLFDLVAKHRSKLSSMLIRRLFADVCSAVVFLHSNMVVHRDIKLENVLLDVKVTDLLKMEHPEQYPGPLAIVTDLGLARKIDPESPMLTTRCGSDDYVPPEIILGQPYDGRETDSWALGVLLYAMLEGRLPFDVPPNQAMMDNNRQRIRTAHRIARVDWTWYKRKDVDQVWHGGLEVVEGCLQRRSSRLLASKTLQVPWVSQALPRKLNDTHDVFDLWKLFIQ